ncbi:MAG: photosystem I assembly protein Ycf3 [Spirochaetes bacterium ADurb.BinA120]|nr:MAG: photosystem I assembly protein Ycf3 [Spirochaetes bacterium ADurb.BinA120]
MPHAAGGPLRHRRPMHDSASFKRYNNALRLEKEGNYVMALHEYVAAIEVDPSNRDAYLNLGSLYSRMNRLGEAMDCYSKALELGDDYLVHFNMGGILYKRGEYKQAVLTLEKSRRLNGSFPLTLLVMGLAFSRLRNHNAASACFERVLELDAGNRIALTALAIIELDRDDYERSLRLIDRILTDDSTNGGARKLRADVLYRMNRLDESASEIKSLRNEEGQYRSYDEFIRTIPLEIFTDRYGTIEEKIAALGEKTASGDRDSLLGLSLCYLLTGDSDRAIDLLFEAKKNILN